jgi:hypothetical protein
MSISSECPLIHFVIDLMSQSSQNIKQLKKYFKSFREILSSIIIITKANYIIENYEDIKAKFRPESEERLNNINMDPLTLF